MKGLNLLATITFLLIALPLLLLVPIMQENRAEEQARDSVNINEVQYIPQKMGIPAPALFEIRKKDTQELNRPKQNQVKPLKKIDSFPIETNIEKRIIEDYLNTNDNGLGDNLRFSYQARTV